MDPETGVLHFFRYSTSGKPYVHYGQLAPDGSLLQQLPLDVPDPIMMHDFAITSRHAVFLDCPLMFIPERMVKEKDVPFVFDRKRGSRVGLLPFSAKVGGGGGTVVQEWCRSGAGVVQEWCRSVVRRCSG